MSDSLAHRITMRLKFVSGIDRRLLMEARDALAGSELSAESVYRWLLENDIKPMGWQVQRFADRGVDVG